MKKGLLLLVYLYLISTSLLANQLTGSSCLSALDSRVIDEFILNLQYCGLSDKDMITVANYLSKHSDITAIDLSNNTEISAKGYATLSKIKSLEVMNAKYNMLADAQIKAIAANTNLRGVNLEGNNLTFGNGFRDLVMLPDLLMLGLANTNFDDANSIHLANLLASKTNPVVWLFLMNNNIGSKGATAISKLSELDVLRLDNNIVRDEGAIAIATNCTAPGLVLTGNGISDKGAFAFAQKWRPVISLPYQATLALGKNNITDQGAIALAESNIPSEITLDISFNLLTTNSINKLKNKFHRVIYDGNPDYGLTKSAMLKSKSNNDYSILF